MSDFEKALGPTLEAEGGYDNDPADPGSETNLGITIADARANGYGGPMKDLPLDVARAIYRSRYWDPIMGDQMPDQAIADKLFDSGVNIGVVRVVRHLQDTLNVLNQQGKLYPDTVPDGIMGPATIEALTLALACKPWYRDVILKALNGLQAAYYVKLAKDNPRLERFAPGWLRTRVQ